jgi:hypothetical protein
MRAKKKKKKNPNHAKFLRSNVIQILSQLKEDGRRNDLFLEHVQMLTYVGQTALLFSNMHLNVD